MANIKLNDSQGCRFMKTLVLFILLMLLEKLGILSSKNEKENKNLGCTVVILHRIKLWVPCCHSVRIF